MGSFDGVEVCELVGFYLLDILKSDFSRKSVDGLSYFENKSGPKLGKIKKRVCKSFKDNGLNITIETDVLITEYLDVLFHLKLENIIRIENKIIVCNKFISNLTIQHQ